MLKRKKIILCLTLIITLCASLSVSAAEPIRVVLDGSALQFDVQPTIIDGRTMVPMRAIFEALGANVEWNGTTRTITATRGDMVVISTIGDRTMIVNGQRIIMDVAPVIIDGRTLVPVRFVSEAFGCDVEWDGSTRTVYIHYMSDDYGDGNISEFIDTNDEHTYENYDYDY